MLLIVYCLIFFIFFNNAITLNISRDDVSSSMFLEMMWTTAGSKNSKFNPDVCLNTVEMIKRAGYPAEAHVVLTKDGYLLTLHRIPGNKDSPAVLLQHGLLGSSADWVISGRGKGLAYILADHGYDVWLGNIRGNTYSRAHISLSTSDVRFWNFSFHEMGVYDLPAMISHITTLKSQPLHAYIGFSMGTTVFYVMAAQSDPQITRMVQKMISLAPVAFLEHVKGPIRYFAPLSYHHKIIDYLLGPGELLPQSSMLRFLEKYTCDIDVYEKKLCSNIIFLLCGFDTEQFNYTLMPVILSHNPAGASAKTLEHFGQGILTGKFRPFDYSYEKNLIIYNATEPPDYDLRNIKIPIALFYGDNDWLADTVDVKKLYSMLKNVLDIYRVPFPKFNHVDFIWAKDAPKLVFERLLKILNNKNLKGEYINDEKENEIFFT